MGMANLQKMAQQMQQEMLRIQTELESTLVDGSAGGGVVKATVSAQSVLIAGELVGDCHATQRAEIQPSGRLTGNIRAPRVVIVEGATFRGNSDMSPGREGEKA